MRARVLSTLMLLVAATLFGCVRTNTEMLDSSTAVISARGTAFDTPATVIKTTLTEAAQLGQQRGYAYFAIVSARDATRTATIVEHGTTYIRGNMSGTITGYDQGYGFSGSMNGSYSGVIRTTPDTLMTLVKPGSDVVVRFFREGEVDPLAPGIWNIAAVVANASDLPVSSSSNAAVRKQPGAAPVADFRAIPRDASRSSQSLDSWKEQNRN